MSVYYNEHDPFAAAWLRELIKAGEIPDGFVDTRDIQNVAAADLDGYAQCHFFAGIGGWAYALQLAGWPPDRPVWTGSCPCQPFSAAGQGKGGADDRHLWPHWARLIRECHPATIVGEQVESAIAHGWLDAVFDDLESEGYACGAVNLPAASVGAPHRRQRIWFVAESETVRLAGRSDRQDGLHQPIRSHTGASGKSDAESRTNDLVAESSRAGTGRDTGSLSGTQSKSRRRDGTVSPCGADDLVADDISLRRQWWETTERPTGEDKAERSARAEEPDGSSHASPWADCTWLPCRDGKWRAVEPGLFPLAHGVSARVGRLRGYGNAITPQVAAEVLSAFLSLEEP